MLLKLKIVTPLKKVFEEEDIESITIPTESGEITVLPEHIPLISKTSTGEIVVRKKGKTSLLFSAEGFMKISPNGEILILADYAVRSEEMEIKKIEEAKKKAEEAMKEKVSERDFAIAETELKRTLQELKYYHRRKSSVS